MYEANHREASFASISYYDNYTNPPLPPSISNPHSYISLSSDSSLPHPNPPPPIDPYPNSGTHPPNYTALDDRPHYYQDPVHGSSNWVVKQAPPVRYSAIVQPQIQEPVAPTNYDASYTVDWASRNWPTNALTRKSKRPKAMKKKIGTSENVKCQLCRIECTSIELYQKHLSGKKHANNLQKLYAPNITSKAAKASKSTAASSSEMGTSGGEGNAVVSKVTDLETKKKKLLECGTAVQSLKICAICNVACNGEIAFADHMAGKKHLAQERALTNQANPNALVITNPKRKCNETATPKTTSPGSPRCEVCKISCTSSEGLLVHTQGKKHKKNLEKLQILNASTTAPAQSKEPEDMETKKRKVLICGAAADAVKACAICNVVCNSETVFNSHLAGQKHAAMVKQKEAAEAGEVAGATDDAGRQVQDPAS